MTQRDFEDFHAQLSRLSDGTATEARLENLEADFRLHLAVRHTGSVTVVGQLTPYPKRGSLEFTFDSDIASIDTATRRIAAALERVRKLS